MLALTAWIVSAGLNAQDMFTPRRLTSHTAREGLPCWSYNEGAIWSPDGTKIAFNSTRSENADVWIMELDIERIRIELGMSQ